MGLRRIIVLLIAVIAAGGTAMYARSWIEGQQAIAAVAAPAPKEDDARGAGRRPRSGRRHLRQAPAPALAALADRRRARDLRAASGVRTEAGHDRRRGAQAHRRRRADHRRRRGQARRARLPRRRAQPRHARGVGADHADLRQLRPDLSGRPDRSDPDPDPDRRAKARAARAGSARPCSRTSASSRWASRPATTPRRARTTRRPRPPPSRSRRARPRRSRC